MVERGGELKGVKGPNLQGEKKPKAADMPLYLSVVNTHQVDWGSQTSFMIGIV